MIRVFVVGCPRSGTTLLQAMLGAHPEIFTFPETHFFRKIWGRMWRWRRLGVLSPTSARWSWSETRRIVRPRSRSYERAPMLPAFRIFASRFRDMVDSATRDRSKETWVDKSPVHLHCIDLIESTIPAARFVHVIRDGRQVIASFAELCFRGEDTFIRQAVSPERWHRSKPRALDRSTIIEHVTDRWQADAEISLEYSGRPGHLLVRYGDLTEHPRSVLGSVCSFMSMDYSDAMLRFQEGASEVIGHRAVHAHMRGPLGGLVPQGLVKYERIFDDTERERIERRIEEVSDRIQPRLAGPASGGAR